mmetsp:Transcript_22369/g.68877  ORF Transcript_22369/g.68877 Transcript_22369/m.68877 type:complete len:224 (+) Transcript_22369:2267-2938(+)
MAFANRLVTSAKVRARSERYRNTGAVSPKVAMTVANFRAAVSSCVPCRVVETAVDAKASGTPNENACDSTARKSKLSSVSVFNRFVSSGTAPKSATWSSVMALRKNRCAAPYCESNDCRWFQSPMIRRIESCLAAATYTTSISGNGWRRFSSDSTNVTPSSIRSYIPRIGVSTLDASASNTSTNHPFDCALHAFSTSRCTTVRSISRSPTNPGAPIVSFFLFF